MKRPVKMRRGFRKILPFPFLQRTDVLMNSAVLRGRVTGLQVTLRLLNFLGKAMRPPRNCSLPWPFAAALVRWSTQPEFIRVNIAQKPPDCQFDESAVFKRNGYEGSPNKICRMSVAIGSDA